MSATEDSSHDARSIILAVVPKVPALISIVCSSAIVRKVYKSPKKRKNVYHRILCGLSCCDIISSFVYFLGTWLIPANKVGGFGLVFGASGNDATCSLSGFFTQFAVSSPLYNGTLAWYYLVSIYYNWSDRKIHNIEKYFHIIPIGFALISSSIALGFDMYGNVEWLCWINPDDEEPSEAQKYFRIFQWVCLFGPVWVTVAFVTTVMYMLYKKMRENEKKMEKYKFPMKSDTIVISKEDENRASMQGKKRSSLKGKLSDNKASADSRIDPKYASKTTLNSSLRNSHITQSDGWKNLRNSTQKDNEGWKNLRRSDVKVVVSLTEEVIRTDAAIDCNDGPSITADESKLDRENLLKQSSAPLVTTPLVASLREDTKVDVEVQNKYVPSTVADDAEINDENGSRPSSRSLSNSLNSTSLKKNKLYNNASKSRQIAIQGMLYVCAFYVTWLFPTLQRITEFAVSKNFFVLQFFDTMLLPMQGILNFGIYIRPRMIKFRNEKPELGFWNSLWKVACDTT